MIIRRICNGFEVEQGSHLIKVEIVNNRAYVSENETEVVTIETTPREFLARQAFMFVSRTVRYMTSK